MLGGKPPRLAEASTCFCCSSTWCSTITNLCVSGWEPLSTAAACCPNPPIACPTGNSGGPALRDDVVVGVAFQNVPNADNIGYIIPLPVVRRFMR